MCSGALTKLGLGLVMTALLWSGTQRNLSAGEGEAPELGEREEILDPQDRATQRLLARYLPDVEIPEGFMIKQVIEVRGSPISDDRRIEYVRVFVPINEEGKKHGPALYYPRGRGGTRRIVQYKEGVRDGYEEIFGHADGVGLYVVERRPWVDGRLHGARERYHPDGSVHMTGTIEDGEPQGESRTYCRDGKLREVAHYEEGRLHGERVQYWAGAETVRRIIPYDRGTVHGMVLDYHPNGELRRKMPHRNGMLHGIEQHFCDEGRLERERYWLDDELVPRGRFDREYEDELESE